MAPLSIFNSGYLSRHAHSFAFCRFGPVRLRLLAVARPDDAHEVFVNAVEVLNENAEHELDHLAVEGRVDEGQADIKVDQPIGTQVVLENFVFDIEVVDIFGDSLAFVRGYPGNDLGPDQRKDAGIDKDRHRQDLPLRFDAGAENDGLIFIVERFRTEYINLVFHEKFLELQGFRVRLYAL